MHSSLELSLSLQCMCEDITSVVQDILDVQESCLRRPGEISRNQHQICKSKVQKPYLNLVFFFLDEYISASPDFHFSFPHDVALGVSPALLFHM
jgi:hypothetical protein